MLQVQLQRLKNKIRPYWSTAKVLVHHLKIALNPSDAEQYLLLGKTLSRRKQCEKAVIAYENSIKLNSRDYQAYFHLGEILNESGKYTDALINLQQAIELNPKYFYSYYQLGLAYLNLSKYSEALINLQQAIELNPQHDWSYYQLGLAYLNLSKYSEAIINFQQAIELNPQNAWCHYQLGLALKAQRQWEAAAKAFYRHIELDPTHRYSYDLLAHIIDKLPKPLSISGENINSFSFDNLTHKLVTATNPQFEWQSDESDGVRQPNFIIIGQQKCGTTSLYSYLIKHPQILPGLKKEIHFWNLNSDKTLEWYLSHFPPIAAEQSFITGEASTTYFDHPDIAAQIVKFFPKTKLIVLLRNPVERTISRYHMACRLSEEDRPLETAIFQRLKEINNDKNIDLTDNKSDRLYFTGSQYIDKIEQWMTVFPSEQSLILKSEDMFAHPKATVDLVFNFLDLEPYSLDTYSKVNYAKYNSISSSETEALQDYFRPFNQRLEIFLNRKFDWYK